MLKTTIMTPSIKLMKPKSKKMRKATNGEIRASGIQ
jgi:hypothetical protein